MERCLELVATPEDLCHRADRDLSLLWLTRDMDYEDGNAMSVDAMIDALIQKHTEKNVNSEADGFVQMPPNLEKLNETFVNQYGFALPWPSDEKRYASNTNSSTSHMFRKASPIPSRNGTGPNSPRATPLGTEHLTEVFLDQVEELQVVIFNRLFAQTVSIEELNIKMHLASSDLLAILQMFTEKINHSDIS